LVWVVVVVEGMVTSWITVIYSGVWEGDVWV
jgi:hypothetical protein